MPALFFAFQFENPWQLLKFCCQKQPPGLFLFSDFITYSHADSSESAGNPLSPRRAMLTAWWHISWYSSPEGKPRAHRGLFDPCLWSYCYNGSWYSVLLSEDLRGGTEFLQKKQIGNHLISKKSLAALYCQSIWWQALCCSAVMFNPRLRRIMQQNAKKGGRELGCDFLCYWFLTIINRSIINRIDRCLLEIKKSVLLNGRTKPFNPNRVKLRRNGYPNATLY